MPILFMGLIALGVFIAMGVLCMVAVRAEGRDQRAAAATAHESELQQTASPCCRHQA